MYSQELYSHHVSIKRARQVAEVDPSEQECVTATECSVSEDSRRQTG